jgi:release factor glutamine methyltransferase
MTAPAPAPATSPAVAALSRAALVDELAAHLGARHEARFIVDEVLAGERSALGRPHAVPAPVAEEAHAMAARRAAGEPLQYVFGHWPFRALDLTVTPQVLIPRPETEQVVEVVLAELRALGVADPVVVDAGTGSGAIALALATEAPGAAVWATDVSADALAVATANLARVRHAIARPGDTVDVTFVEGSWLEPLPPALRGMVNLVVANPPYVAESEWAGLPAEVRAEPRVALVAASGPDGTPGLACVEAVLEQARTWLTRPGVVVIELAPQQAAAATARATALGYGAVRVEPDLTGRPRCLVAHAC